MDAHTAVSNLSDARRYVLLAVLALMDPRLEGTWGMIQTLRSASDQIEDDIRKTMHQTVEQY